VSERYLQQRHDGRLDLGVHGLHGRHAVRKPWPVGAHRFVQCGLLLHRSIIVSASHGRRDWQPVYGGYVLPVRQCGADLVHGRLVLCIQPAGSTHPCASSSALESKF
jgi:hypothetical protein